MPPADKLIDTPLPPVPTKIGGAVDFAPVCAAAVQACNDDKRSVRDWIDAHGGGH